MLGFKGVFAKRKKLQQIAHDILAAADIKINGDRPWDIKIHDERFYKRILRGGSVAFGEVASTHYFRHIVPMGLSSKI